MVQRSTILRLFAIILCFSMTCTGCTTTGIALVDGFTACVEDVFDPDSNQIGWKEFIEERPEVLYVHSGKRGLDRACAEVTDFYAYTLELLDRTIISVKNCKPAYKLEKVREEYGEEAYFLALDKMPDEERVQYYTYIENEVDDLELYAALEEKYYRLQQLYPRIYYDLYDLQEQMSYGLYSGDMYMVYESGYTMAVVADNVNTVMNQGLFSIKCINWMGEYKETLQRAMEHTGR